MGRRVMWVRLVVLVVVAAIFGCRQATAPGTLRIGLAEEPRTLNVWLASDANSRKVLSLIYQPL